VRYSDGRLYAVSTGVSASGVAHLLDGFEPRCCGGILPHGADGDGLGWSVDLVLLDDKVCETVRQLLHDMALRDGWKTSLDAQFRSTRTLVGLLGPAAQLR
jgi:hypothetical protein